jgi:predicted CXXCH cytochrome family protein
MVTETVLISKLKIFLAVLFLSCGLLAVPAFTAQEIPCLNCHSKFNKHSKNDHAALGIGCSACHGTVQDKKHPQQKGSIKLIREVPDLCYGCHKRSKFQNTDIHSPVEAGKCTGCHNPHTSAFSGLLLSDPPELCYGCHDKVNFTKKYLHPVIIGRRCDCHNPHASNFPSLLSTTVNEGCLGCHKNKGSGNHVVSLSRGKVHPIEGIGPGTRNTKKMISCATCHNPHSSDFRKLFPKARVCRICHKYY